MANLDLWDAAFDWFTAATQQLGLASTAQTSRYRAYLTRGCLVDPSVSAWAQLRDGKDDKAYIKYLRFDVSTFSVLASLVTNARPERTFGRPPKGGRLPSSWAEDATALALAFLTNTGDASHFQLEFGLTPAVLSRELNAALAKLEAVVAAHPDAMAEMPTEEECLHFATLLKQHAPGYEDAVHDGLFLIGFIDGTTFPIPAHSDRETQRAYYSGFKGQHYINNIFMFCPDGTIRCAVTNLPGAWHDAHASQPIYAEIEQTVAPWGFCVLDEHSTQ